MILMGCTELVDGLARAEVLLADGTFKVVPSICFQLCSMPLPFMSGLKNDMQRQKSFFLQGVTGVDHTSAKRYRKLNDRVKRAIATYHTAALKS